MTNRPVKGDLCRRTANDIWLGRGTRGFEKKRGDALTENKGERHLLPITKLKRGACAQRLMETEINEGKNRVGSELRKPRGSGVSRILSTIGLPSEAGKPREAIPAAKGNRRIHEWDRRSPCKELGIKIGKKSGEGGSCLSDTLRHT